MIDKEEINSQAYNDVLDRIGPTSDDPYYMQCYRNWYALVAHEDRLLDPEHHEDYIVG